MVFDVLRRTSELNSTLNVAINTLYEIRHNSKLTPDQKMSLTTDVQQKVLPLVMRHLIVLNNLTGTPPVETPKV